MSDARLTRDRTFPILHSQNDVPGSRSNLDWDFVEQYRAACERNHHQDLETLASRGGLAWSELWSAMTGERLPIRNSKDNEFDRKACEYVMVQYRKWRAERDAEPGVALKAEADAFRTKVDELNKLAATLGAKHGVLVRYVVNPTGQRGGWDFLSVDILKPV